MKLKLCLMGLLCLFFQVSAYAQTDKRFLKPGDKMPDLAITNIINAKFNTAKISDFKGKMVILDFWNSYCSSCIAGFPKLDSMQRQFKGRLQVILINPASDSETLRSMKIVIDRMNSWSDQRFTLPIAFHDTIISKQFDFYGVPYGVWIAPDGTIVGMPDKTEITAQNISKILAGDKLLLKQKVNRRPVSAGKAVL